MSANVAMAGLASPTPTSGKPPMKKVKVRKPDGTIVTVLRPVPPSVASPLSPPLPHPTKVIRPEHPQAPAPADQLASKAKTTGIAKDFKKTATPSTQGASPVSHDAVKPTTTDTAKAKGGSSQPNAGNPPVTQAAKPAPSASSAKEVPQTAPANAQPAPKKGKFGKFSFSKGLDSLTQSFTESAQLTDSLDKFTQSAGGLFDKLAHRGSGDKDGKAKEQSKDTAPKTVSKPADPGPPKTAQKPVSKAAQHPTAQKQSQPEHVATRSVADPVGRDANSTDGASKAAAGAAIGAVAAPVASGAYEAYNSDTDQPIEDYEPQEGDVILDEDNEEIDQDIEPQGESDDEPIEEYNPHTDELVEISDQEDEEAQNATTTGANQVNTLGSGGGAGQQGQQSSQTQQYQQSQQYQQPQQAQQYQQSQQPVHQPQTHDSDDDGEPDNGQGNGGDDDDGDGDNDNDNDNDNDYNNNRSDSD